MAGTTTIQSFRKFRVEQKLEEFLCVKYSTKSKMSENWGQNSGYGQRSGGGGYGGGRGGGGYGGAPRQNYGGGGGGRGGFNNFSDGPSSNIEIDSNKVGIVIGRGGAKIREIQDNFKVHVKIDREAGQNGYTGVTIRGDDTAIENAKTYIQELVAAKI
ncbi:hypothetical protein Bhyg_11073 [Pseudolycoriella hygida]|uniref:K Homology domain-containing protein n=1 Tax=Pseudolycoriella hygida TaxID=35572 RepID=A0A9Q0RZU8_9DIPT|nr:hypothetical protein Bhyg_11073 [Pseudolycoriella hygida]